MAIPKVTASRNEGRYAPTGPLTADTTISTTSGTLGAIAIIDDGGNAATVSLHWGQDNTGLEMNRWISGGDGVPTGWEDIEAVFSGGLYLDVTTSGTVEVFILYRED